MSRKFWLLVLGAIAAGQCTAVYADEFHGTFCERAKPSDTVLTCQPVTGTVTWPDGTTDASSELSRSFRGQFGAPIATEVIPQPNLQPHLKGKHNDDN